VGLARQVGQGWQREREGEVLIRNLKTEIEIKKGFFLKNLSTPN
jgi:hypothetical protein